MIPEGGRLDPQPWMTAPETRAVIAALTREGAEVRFVGGCVRDSLLGQPVRDVDIATHEPPERVMALLRQDGIRAIPTGLAHGTITAVTGGAHFEITTLRRDVKSHGRHADVVFTDDWVEDAARRDFTINALSLAPDGTLYDPFGGLEDLKLGRVRFVGDAESRIREDVLRLLRFFRFFAYYDRPPPDPDAWAAAVKLAPLLPGLSGERVWSELRRILAAPDPAAAFRMMAEAGALAQVLPEACAFERLDALHRIEDEVKPGPPSPFPESASKTDEIRRLAAVVDPGNLEGGTVAGRIGARLRLSRHDRDRLARLLTPFPGLDPEMDARAARRAIYETGRGAGPAEDGNSRFEDLLLLMWAEYRAGGMNGRVDASCRHLLEIARRWPRPRLPVRGADALERGVPAGPKIGEALAAVESWWCDRDFQPQRAACLAQLDRVAAALTA